MIISGFPAIFFKLHRLLRSKSLVTICNSFAVPCDVGRFGLHAPVKDGILAESLQKTEIPHKTWSDSRLQTHKSNTCIYPLLITTLRGSCGVQ